jgi:4a-hydroxytetrahydrobiopterin dehydratase
MSTERRKLPLLSQEEIGEGLAQLSGWRLEGKALVSDYAFPSFMKAMEFVNGVAQEADGIDHHPDMTIRYTRVTLSLWTHDSGGVTRRDFRLASAIDGLKL